MMPLDGTTPGRIGRLGSVLRTRRGWSGAAAALLVVLLAAVDTASADGPLSPNQPVSLDDTPAVPPRGTELPPSSATEGPAEQAAVARAEQTAVASPSRELRRPSRPGTDSGPVSSLSRTWNPMSLWPLAVVLGLVGFAAWFVRRWVPGATTGGTSALRVLARVGVTPKQHAVLVQCGRRLLLVGASPDRMELLCEISDAVECAELASRVGAPSAAPGFSDALVREARAYADEESAIGNRADLGRRAPATTASGAAELIQRLRTLKAGQPEA